MKKLIVILVALIATPAFALTVSCTDLGDGVVQISYAGADINNLPVAFALSVSVDAGTIDTLVADSYVIGECNAVTQGYGIFPGTIDIVALTGAVTSYGTPVAPVTAPDAPGQLGSASIILEMGALWEAGNETAVSGPLCQLIVSESCTVTLDDDLFRGGVVTEDSNSVDVGSSCGITVSAGGCATCPGDMEPDGWVTTNDLALMLSNLATAPGNYYQIAPGQECHDMEPDGWATTNDLAILLSALATAPGNYYQCP